jgi:hypothetical protein
VRSAIAALLQLASLVICLIVIAAFAVFVFDEAKGASAHQQEALVKGGSSNTNGERPSSGGTSSTSESTPHRLIDEASNAFTSPFSGITSGWTSTWAIHGVNLLLALLVYGFAFAFLARVLRARL